MSVPTFDPFAIDVQVQAFIALLQDALDLPDVYEFGNLPGLDQDDSRDLPTRYVLLGVYRVPVPGETRRWSGDTGQSLWELEVSHGGTTHSEAGWLFGRLSTALDDQVVTFADGPLSDDSGPIEFVTHDSPVEQGNRWVGRATWSYGL